MLLFKSTNRSFLISAFRLNINYSICLVQRKCFCSNEETHTIEKSLISIFVEKPFCLESPMLQELSPKLTPRVVETVLRSFRDWRLAMVFFNWASNQEGYAHSCYAYNAMAAVLSNARQNAPLKDLAVNLTQTRCFWTPGALGFFIRCLGSRGLVEEANSLFDQVKISGICELNGYSYNCLLEVFGKSGDIDLLEYRLDEMRNLGWPIDKHALTPALQCYCNAGNFDKALMVFNDLNEKGWVDQHILAILVLSYSKNREVDLAFELIEWAEGNLKITLNEKTLCVLIHGFVREDRVDRALELYHKMKRLRYVPDVSIYDVLIRGLCKNNEVEKAMMLYVNMREAGLFPDQRIISELLMCIKEQRDMIKLLEDTLMKLDVCKRMPLYSSILTGLVNGGYADKAYYLLKASGKNGNSQADEATPLNLKPDTTCFQTVIDGLCNANKLDMALDLFLNIDCRRSVVLYNNLILALSNADRLNECFDLLNEMKETEFRPTHFTFNCILGCFCRRLDVVGALELLREMRAFGHVPWIKHYTLLVTKLCENGKADEACNFLIEMTREGFLPDMIAYSAIIDGFVNTNELDRGLNLFKEIRDLGYFPDVVAYNTIIKGLCKAKRIAEAEDFLQELLDKGLVPSVVTYNLLIDGWCKDGNTDQALLYFARMKDEEKEANVITYTTLVDGLCNAGKRDDALDLWIEMENKGCEPNRVAYMALIHGLCKCRDADCALIYLQKMEEKHMLPDTYIYQAVIDAFASNSNMEMAHKVLEKMAKRGTAAA